MIAVFKIVKGHDKLEHTFFILQGTGRTRGHTFKLNRDRSGLEIRNNFFSQRVVKQWNEFPCSVAHVEAESVNSFKNRSISALQKENQE
jgi:hypothetical protein